jgi:hypothetical protein
MRWIWGFAIEIYRLFVDDGFFALAIVAWLALLWLMLHLLPALAGWAGLLFFVGLAAILLESVRRRAAGDKAG